MTDEEAIRQLISRYCHYIDGPPRIAELVSLFTADGSFEGPGRSAKGDQLAEFFSAASERNGGHVKHVTVNSAIEVTGNNATGVSDWLAVRDTNGPIEIFTWGRYTDSYVKSGGQWRILSRRFSKGNDA